MQTTSQPTRPACTAAERDAILIFAAVHEALAYCAVHEARYLGAFGLGRLVREIEHDVATLRLVSYANH